MSPPSPRLSVVVACVEAERTLSACLEALRTACEGFGVEILVVHDAGDPPPGVPWLDGPPVIRVARPGPALVPQLWAAGLQQARGEAVAFTTAHCVVSPAWATTLLAGLDAGAVGAGGMFELDRRTGGVGAAVFFLRYSAFLTSAPTGEVTDIAGDNALYRRTALQAHAASFVDGFWEVEFHRRIRAEGGRLLLLPGATVRFYAFPRFTSMLRQRFQHGRRFGRYRVAAGQIMRRRAVLAMPLIPLVLLGRIVRRTVNAGDRIRLIASLPALVCLASAWALGEAWGAGSATSPPSILPAYGTGHS